MPAMGVRARGPRLLLAAVLSLSPACRTGILGGMAEDRRTALEVAMPVAERFVRYRYHAWHYPQGVAFFGLLALSDATGDPRWRDYVASQIDQFHATRAGWGEPPDSDPGYGAKDEPPGFRPITRAEALRLGVCPWCAPAWEGGGSRLRVKDDLSAVRVRPKPDNRIQNGVWLELYRRTGGKRFLDWQRAPMEKILGSPLDFSKRPGFTKIVDASFLPATALPRMGAITGERRWFDRAAAVLDAFDGLLRDGATGLYRQGWGWGTEGEDGYTPGFWGRGNGWIVAAMVETLDLLPADHPARERLVGRFRDLCAALARHQGADGMWRNLIERPDAYPETSVTGFVVFAYAKGVRLGLLDPSYLERARRGFAGLKRRVLPDATILDTCTGTSPSREKTLEAYMTRPHPRNDLHGDGPVLLAASEMIRAEAARAP